jgi:hypothetical protein
MIASTVERDVPASRSRLGRYCIRLKVSPAAREDSWELFRVAVHYGGVEVHDCCFAFPSEERWLTALEVLRFRFGPEYFEPVDSGESD